MRVLHGLGFVLGASGWLAASPAAPIAGGSPAGAPSGSSAVAWSGPQVVLPEEDSGAQPVGNPAFRGLPHPGDWEAERESQADLAAGRRLRPVLRLLESTPDDRWLAELESLLQESPALGRDAAILLAGRPLPAGLTGTRQAQRRSSRELALEAIRRDMEAGAIETRNRWLQQLGRHLGGPQAARSQSSPDLQAAAMAVAAHLGLGQFAPAIGRHATSEPRGVVQLSAQAALRRLHGRWILDPEQLDELPAVGEAGQAQLRETFEESSLDMAGLRLRLLELEPATAEELFGGPDPRLRGSAARRLLEAIGKQEMQRERVSELLLARVAREPEALALHAVLVSLVELAQAAGPGAEITSSLRAALRTRAETVTTYLAPVILVGLERLPVSEGSETVVVDAEIASQLLVSMLERGAPVDGDSLVSALGAWSRLAERAARAQAMDEASLRRKARDLVRVLLAEDDESVMVRSAAAAALVRLPQSPQRLGLSLDLLVGGSLPDALRVPVYSLAEQALLAKGVQPTPQQRAQLVASLAQDMGSFDPELRRRAVRLLGQDAIQNMTRGTELTHLRTALRDATLAEELVDLQTAMIAQWAALVDGNAQARALTQLLQAPRVGRLRLPEEQRLRALGDLLKALAGDEGAALMTGARWLMQAPKPLPAGPQGSGSGGGVALDESGAADAESPRERSIRLEAGLRLIGTLSQAQAGALDLDDHREVLGWTETLLAGTSRLALGSVASRRGAALLRNHLPSLISQEPSASILLLEAQLRSFVEPSQTERVLAAFERAVAWPNLSAEEQVRAHRDRLRYIQRRDAAGAGSDDPEVRALRQRDAEFLADSLINSEDEELRPAADRLLDLTDSLRLAEQLNRFLLWHRLVLHSDWRQLRHEERKSHLVARSSRALDLAQSDDWKPLRQVVQNYEGFPDSEDGEASGSPTEDSVLDTLWGDLVQDASLRKELGIDVRRVRARLRRQPLEAEQGSGDQQGDGGDQASR